MELGVEIGKLLVALLVLINPFSALSIYLDLTQDHSTKEKRRIARTAALAVFIVIVVFALGGGILLKVLGISVGSFQVGGGILVLLIAISLMNGNDNPAKPKIDTHSEEHQSAQQVRRNEKAIAVVPIAIPITIGPGGISTVIIYSSAAKKLQRYCPNYHLRLSGQPDLLSHPDRCRTHQQTLGQYRPDHPQPHHGHDAGRHFRRDYCCRLKIYFPPAGRLNYNHHNKRRLKHFQTAS